MNPIRFWLSIFTVLAWVLVLPGWVYFVGDGLTGVPTVVKWLVAILLPMALLLTIGSWVQSWS